MLRIGLRGFGKGDILKQLKHDITLLVTDELIRASEKFGDKHNSSHEAYAVILEEFEEAKQEIAYVDAFLKNYWVDVKQNSAKASTLVDLEECAINGAAELIHVAAMARKALRGYEE